MVSRLLDVFKVTYFEFSPVILDFHRDLGKMLDLWLLCRGNIGAWEVFNTPSQFTPAFLHLFGVFSAIRKIYT